MIGSLGLPEILFILLLALLVFGPKRLPEVGRKVGRALGEFRRATGDLKRTIDRELTVADMGPKRTSGAHAPGGVVWQTAATRRRSPRAAYQGRGRSRRA